MSRKSALKVIGFCRVSTEDQRRNTSLPTQEADIRAYCKLHNLELVDVVSDDETGYADPKKVLAGKDARPTFSRVIKALHEGRAEGLIVWKLDRYSRSVADGLNLFAYFEHRGWQLVSVKDEINTATPAGRAFFQMALVFAEWERNTIVERVKRGLAAKRAAGCVGGGSAPYGWDIREGHYVVNDDEQFVLDKMRIWHKKGVPCHRIADRLNSEGVPSKRGALWSDETVRRILKRPLDVKLPVVPPLHRRLGDRDRLNDVYCEDCKSLWEKCQCWKTVPRRA
jgi:site-specific DNA recombinase